MSWVTSVVVICSGMDSHHVERIEPDLKRISLQEAGGRKWPELHVHAAGFNYWSEHRDRVVRELLAARWTCPENVVITVQPQDGPTEVFRPESHDYSYEATVVHVVAPAPEPELCGFGRCTDGSCNACQGGSL